MGFLWNEWPVERAAMEGKCDFGFECKVGGMEKMGFLQKGVLFDLIMPKEDNPSPSVAASAIENIFHVKTNYSYFTLRLLGHKGWIGVLLCGQTIEKVTFVHLYSFPFSSPYGTYLLQFGTF
jgi:hypothetical protein